MQNNTIKVKICKTTAVAILLVALLAASFSCLFAPSVASAYTYGGVDSATLWHYGEDFLNVQGAKQIVDAWDLSAVSEPVVIAVIDTGISANHEIFKDVLAKNDKGEILGYNSTSGVVDGKVNITDDDSNGHGTSIAGTIAMLIKEFGLENHIKIYPIKANKTDSTSEFSIASLTKAVEWAAENAGADVVNMSLGFTSANYQTKSASERNAFETAIEKARREAIVVAAAGNKDSASSKNDTGYCPASLAGVVGVMNQTKTNKISDYSNFGASYTLCAPGTDIFTAAKVGYQTTSGTSQASAITSFATALLKLRLVAEGKNYDAPTIAKLIYAIADKTLTKGENTYSVIDLLSVVSKPVDALITYVKPTGIEITHDGSMGTGDYANSIYMRADKVKEISLVARVLPLGDVDPDVDNGVEWYIARLNGDGEQVGEKTLIGKGASIKYLPTAGGSYEITATHPNYNISSNAQELYIEYGTYYVGEVRVTLLKNANDDVAKAPSSATIYTHETTSFALTGVQYLNPDVETKWFVNGEHVATGKVFDFKPTKSGTYEITAQYGENVVDFQFKFTAQVKTVIAKPLYLSLLVVGIVLVVGAITAVIVVKRKRVKSN